MKLTEILALIGLTLKGGDMLQTVHKLAMWYATKQVLWRKTEQAMDAGNAARTIKWEMSRLTS